MRTIFLLSVGLALSIATKPVKETAVAQERHIDGERPVQILNGTEEKGPLPEVGGKIRSVVKMNSCPLGWSRYGSRCFIFIHRQLAWADAEKYCLREGANLASIHNIGEYEFIQEVIRGNTDRFPQAWIGGNDAVKDFVWLWSDGSGFYYQDWDITEPDNYWGNEKCIVMNHADFLLWGDENCELELPFVCGSRPVPVARI